MVHVNSFQSGCGERLRAERERLGFSQADLAAKMRIHRNSQARYEKADAPPPLGYLTQLRSLGIDSAYVLTGVRQTEEGERLQALADLVEVIFDTLQLTSYMEEFEGIFRRASCAYAETAAIQCEGVTRGEAADLATARLIKKSPLVLDEATFSELIERIEFVLESTGLEIAPYDKARAILQLYSLGKTQGKPLDLQAIRSVLDSFR